MRRAIKERSEGYLKDGITGQMKGEVADGTKVVCVNQSKSRLIPPTESFCSTGQVIRQN